MKSVLITGDSHVVMLHKYVSTSSTPKFPFSSGGVEITIIPVGPAGQMKGRFFDAFPDHIEFNRDELRHKLSRLPPAQPHYDVIGLSGPLLTNWTWSGDWKNFYLDEAGRTGHFVSRSACERMFLDQSRHMIELVEIVRRTRDVFVIEPPAPFRHHPAVQKNGAAKTMAVFRRYNSFLKKLFSDMDVPVVGLREEWLDQDGFMRAKYRRNDLDTLHGGTELGRLMLEHICDFVRDGRA